MSPRTDDPHDPANGRPGETGSANPAGPASANRSEGSQSSEPLPKGLARIFGGSVKTSARSMDAAYGLVGAVLGLGFIGWLVDRHYGTAPTWLLVGLLLGVVVGLYTLARTVLWKP